MWIAPKASGLHPMACKSHTETNLEAAILTAGN